MRSLSSLLLLSFTAWLLPSELRAADENWPQFRGPGARGVIPGSALPTKWNNQTNVRWKVKLPGRGWSSPIVWGDRIFLTTVINEGETEAAKRGLYFGGDRPEPPKFSHHWEVHCLNQGGQLVWKKRLHSGLPSRSRHLKNSFASETPVTDGEHLYVLFGNLGLFCLTLEGELVWSQTLEAQPTRYAWGTAASPVVHGDRIYLINDNEKQSYLVALDKRNGSEVWRVNRDEGSNWATPFVWENELRTELITPGTGKTRAYDLDGKLLYELGGASSITIATPYSAHGLLYVSSGYILDKKKPLYAIRPGARGDISLQASETSNQYIAWCQKQAAPYNPTTIVYEDLLYVLLDRGFVACYDAKTGEEVYGRQRIPNGRAFTSSPWAHDGNIYCLNEYGETFVIQAGREFKLQHVNRLDEEMCMATPAAAGDQLLIRTEGHLYAIGK